MSKNRFQSIKQYLHFADNAALEQGNKVAKVQPLYTSLNEQLVEWGVFHELLSVDESMVPYFGKHSAKMYIKGKPIRFGYKIWCLCGKDGFPHHLQIYTGKGEERPTQPLGSRVVNTMVGVVEENSDVTRHKLFFDNFFTSYSLLDGLAERGMRSIGTARENRTAGAHKVLTASKVLKKQPRGTYDYRTNGRVYFCKWNDNSVVCAGSNFATHEPVVNVTRRVKNVSNTVVSQPNLISQYNQGMGGVDLFDRLLGSCRPIIRGKKWYWPLLINNLNACVVAAWRLHCRVQETPPTHKAFRRQVTLCLLKGDVTGAISRGISVADLPADIRYDGVGHTKGPATQGRCRVCRRNTRFVCQKCKVRLHFGDRGTVCSTVYHTAPQ